MAALSRAMAGPRVMEGGSPHARYLNLYWMQNSTSWKWSLLLLTCLTGSSRATAPATLATTNSLGTCGCTRMGDVPHLKFLTCHVTLVSIAVVT
eukprot:503683-Rhodomonas_salina.1